MHRLLLAATLLLLGFLEVGSGRIVDPIPPQVRLDYFAQPATVSLYTPIRLTIEVAPDPDNEDRLPLSAYVVVTSGAGVLESDLAGYTLVSRSRPFRARPKTSGGFL